MDPSAIWEEEELRRELAQLNQRTVAIRQRLQVLLRARVATNGLDLHERRLTLRRLTLRRAADRWSG